MDTNHGAPRSNKTASETGDVEFDVPHTHVLPKKNHEDLEDCGTGQEQWDVGQIDVPVVQMLEDVVVSLDCFRSAAHRGAEKRLLRAPVAQGDFEFPCMTFLRNTSVSVLCKKYPWRSVLFSKKTHDSARWSRSLTFSRVGLPKRCSQEHSGEKFS